MPPDGFKQQATPAPIFEVPQRYPVVASLQFDLTDPDGKVAFEQACKARDYLVVLWDMDNYLRDQVKYEGEDDTEAIRKKFHALLEERRIHLD